MRVAWIARGQIFVQDGTGPATPVESEYGQRARARAAESAQRNAWKSQGAGALFMGAVSAQALQTSEIPLYVTGLARGLQSELLYSLETREVGGLFAVPREGPEKRLFHAANQLVRDPCAHPAAPVVACAVPNLKGGSWHLGLLSLEGGGLTEITEGDTIDRHPTWVPDEPRVLLYESAGIGRSAQGRVMGLAPSVLQRLDVKTGELQTIAQVEGRDLCCPKVGPDGALYYLEKPHAAPQTRSIFRALLAVLLVPLHLLLALWGWLSLFTLRYSGRPLAGGKDTRAKHADARQMFLWGNMAQAHQSALDDLQSEKLREVRAPASWRLYRRTREGQSHKLADGVATYDLTPRGEVVYSDGVEIWLLPPDGKPTRLAKDTGIQQVLCLE